jgi:hypothetical protein
VAAMRQQLVLAVFWGTNALVILSALAFAVR